VSVLRRAGSWRREPAEAVLKRLLPRVVGALAILMLLPVVVHAGVRLYVAWFMRQAERPVAERQLTVDERGTLVIRGAEIRSNARDLPRSFAWEARFLRAGASGPEFIGTWEARNEGTTVHVFGDLVVVVPNTDYYERGVQRLFVRRKTGKWREVRLDFGDIADGIDPPLLTAYKTAIAPADLARIRGALATTTGARWLQAKIDRVDSARGEIVVRVTLGATDLRLRLGPTEDGERLLVLGIERVTS
jgi:hypothetical protein